MNANHDLEPAMSSFRQGVALIERVKELEAELKQVKRERDEAYKVIQQMKEQSK